jgi:hypothetical protein
MKKQPNILCEIGGQQGARIRPTTRTYGKGKDLS